MKYDFIFPLIAAILAGAYFIGSEIFIRYFGEQVLIMAIIINFSGGICLGLFIKGKKKKLKKMPKKDIISLVICSIFIFGLAMVFFYKSINLIGSAKSGFLAQVEPLFIALLAVLFLKEKFNLKELPGLLLIFFGAVLLNFNWSSVSLSFGLGEIYAILTALMFSVGIIISSGLIKKYGASLVTCIEMIFGGCLLSLFLIISTVSINIYAIICLIPLGFIYALCWLFYNTGIKTAGASKTSIIYSTKAFFILIFSYLITTFASSLNVKIPLNIIPFLIGGIMIFFGIFILEKYKLKQSRKVEPL
ncbi:MAG: DMT family transporter [Candidatus Aenigmarchaeota archaeon]|nr:DMT family transporter [Candidatus Aenigmarchaeota archaeon]